MSKGVIRVGKGKAMVTIRGTLAVALDRELRAVMEPVITRMETEAETILKTARAEWPVLSGLSRGGWGSSLRVLPGSLQVEVFITNREDYVRYIKSTKVGKDKDATRLRSPFQVSVRAPARLATRALVRDLPAILGAQLEQVFHG